MWDRTGSQPARENGFSCWWLLPAWVPASCDAAAPVQPAALSKLLKLSVAVCWKARNVTLAGTEQELGATEKVVRRRSSSGAAGSRKLHLSEGTEGRCFPGTELLGSRTALCSDSCVPGSVVQSFPCHIRAIRALRLFQARVAEAKRFIAAEHRPCSDLLQSREKLAGILLMSKCFGSGTGSGASLWI